MCDITDLEKLLLQKKNEEKKAQDDATKLGFIQGGEFEGFFNVVTGKRAHIEENEIIEDDEAEIIDFPDPQK